MFALFKDFNVLFPLVKTANLATTKTRDKDEDFYADAAEAASKDCRHRVCTSFEEMMAKWGGGGGGKSNDESSSKGANSGTGKKPLAPVTLVDFEEEKNDKSSRRRRTDCPVDKDELGRSTWTLLHTMSVYYPEKPTDEEKKYTSDFLRALSKTYPCEPCARDFQADLRANPPRLEGRDAFAQWMCEAHNRVNKKLGKPLFPCGDVLQRWLDGWKDGSCDY